MSCSGFAIFWRRVSFEYCACDFKSDTTKTHRQSLRTFLAEWVGCLCVCHANLQHTSRCMYYIRACLCFWCAVWRSRRRRRRQRQRHVWPLAIMRFEHAGRRSHTTCNKVCTFYGSPVDSKTCVCCKYACGFVHRTQRVPKNNPNGAFVRNRGDVGGTACQTRE